MRRKTLAVADVGESDSESSQLRFGLFELDIMTGEFRKAGLLV